jgi:hypothetical protein
LDLLAQLVLRKRTPIETLVGILGPKHFAKDPDNTTTEELQACADCLIQCAELYFFALIDGKAVILIDIDDDVRAELDLMQYPLPLLCPPETVEHNQMVGYYTDASGRKSILLNGNAHNFDVCLDHINRVNETRLTINVRTTAMVRNSWADLDHQKPGETFEKYQRRVKAFEKYDAHAHEVLNFLELNDNVFWLTHRYDTRGRTYAQGYHVNPQGNDWNKAVVEFADKELIPMALS